jgi:iron-sulfur cluster repair protein YtfE (RIC family)
MTGITNALYQHHKRCDEDFASAEEAAQQGDWATCAAALGSFRSGLLAHIGVEEEVLFPAFEQRTGMVDGPTQVMRYEHSQLRALMEQLDQALVQKDGDGYAGVAETLLVLLQQHNMKEENILYPMCERALGPDVAVQSRIDSWLCVQP